MTTLTKKDLKRLLSLELKDPHALLGAHPTPGGVVIRARRPDARAVRAIGEADGQTHELVCVHEAGLFEVLLADRREVFGYELEVEYPGGLTVRGPDPYAFLPSLGEIDVHLAAEGRHEELSERMGAHVRNLGGVRGVGFAVWAPFALGVSVVGDFNSWDGRLHPMRSLGVSGLWELFVPGLAPGAVYKYEIRTAMGPIVKTDPYGGFMEKPPVTASIVHEPKYVFRDEAWMKARSAADPWRAPMSIYEVHLGSWRRVPEEGDRSLTYREAAHQLADYAIEQGFTHVELMPVMEHPFEGSWGYQVTGYFAPTSRYGDPDDFRFFVDHLHERGIGVILDWVPAHFPKDVFSLGRFDGSALYEHLDPRQGEHPDWGTYVFNYGRREVRNFLLASALHWLDSFHVDGLRVDAVASMLYLDYSRQEGEWVPNEHGGRENLEAVGFIRELNDVIQRRHPGVLMIAEESTSWPAVSRETHLGGLGFDFKWNMGWMHDTLHYFQTEPIYRRFHHQSLTFGLLYAWSESYVLPFSHDEVVHGKGSLIQKMPGDRWQKFANLRALFAYMWAHPGKKLIFQGCEIGQWREWSHERSLDWHLLDEPEHFGLSRLVKDLNRIYRAEPALFEADVDPQGFQWIDANDADDNAVSFRRIAPRAGTEVVCVANLSPVPRHDFRVGLPREGRWREILNTDASIYGGSNLGNAGGVDAVADPFHGLPYSASMELPPLAVLWFASPPLPEVAEVAPPSEEERPKIKPSPGREAAKRKRKSTGH
ncbi:MAG: 1,4-alpha-glucan branching protein GlgB [Vicinamibacteria bacterium]|nr:1,4-alpha-glucan branching protein GlgB [Vicinamibacteria bacterium]